MSSAFLKGAASEALNNISKLLIGRNLPQLGVGLDQLKNLGIAHNVHGVPTQGEIAEAFSSLPFILGEEYTQQLAALFEVAKDVAALSEKDVWDLMD